MDVLVYLYPIPGFKNLLSNCSSTSSGLRNYFLRWDRPGLCQLMQEQQVSAESKEKKNQNFTDKIKAHSNQMRAQLGPRHRLSHRCTCRVDIRQCMGTAAHAKGLLPSLMKLEGIPPSQVLSLPFSSENFIAWHWFL